MSSLPFQSSGRPKDGRSMVCGTPVVALRGGAVPEVVVDGVTGLVLDDPADLPAALTRVRDLDPADCRAQLDGHQDGAALQASGDHA